MAKQAWIALVIIATPLAVAPPCLGEDETTDVDNAADASPGVTTIDELLAATSYADSRSVPTALGPAADVLVAPDLAIDFEDNSMFGRLQRERSLSFLTLSSQRRSRLFLGVNEKGYLGLHFTGRSDASDKASADFVPLPPVRAASD